MPTQRSANKDPAGYPDFTLPVSIIAQIIEKLKVDIAAQTLAELKIDIAAQTLPQLDVNIAGQAVTLDVNIAASAITMDISITGQTVSVKLVPDWGAIQAEDVDLYGTLWADTGGFYTVIEYTVPPGKTLLIYDWSLILASANGQVCGALYNATLDVFLSVGGGTRGFQTPFSKPKRIEEGQVIRLTGRQDTGAWQFLSAHLGGVLL